MSFAFRSSISAFAAMFAATFCLGQTAPVQLEIHIDQPLHKVSPMLYGLMTEEINFSYDGGLYAELVRNRTVRPNFDGAAHWSLLERGGATGAMSVEATGPSAAVPDSLKLELKQAPAGGSAGLANEGFWGIPVRPNTSYRASFYAKALRPGTRVTVSLLSDLTGKAAAEQTVDGIGTEWKPFHATLTTARMEADARFHFVISIAEPGTLFLALPSLFPPTYHDRPNGNRADLMEKLAAMHPAFLRFPGGNYLEGDTVAERFDWKKTIGPLVDRPTHPSPWGYRSSDGLGLLEFLEWCEDLHMQPVLAVYAGYSLKGAYVQPGAALAPYVQDALDEIEYVTGDASTKWGAERARDGHPAPFPLHYIEIGNEDWFDKSGSYEGRYPQFYDAIKGRYPQLELIATMPVKNGHVDVLDEHYYRSTGEFYRDTHHYDAADRKGPKIFVGEWATREGVPTPNFGAALADAAWMTGMERNSDIVVMASYAPLLTNVNPGGLQWDTDLLGYNAMGSYGSPSYWAQVLFSTHHGDEILTAELDGAPDRVYTSVTRDAASGLLHIKLVNASEQAMTVAVRLRHAGSIENVGRLFTLSAPSPEATDSIGDPERVVPAERDLSGLGESFPLPLAPLSINVLDVRASPGTVR